LQPQREIGLESTAAVFIGAGYSAVAGLPLASNLFAHGDLLFGGKRAQERCEQVLEAWACWSESNPGVGSEEFLMAVKQGQVGIEWGWVIQYLCTALGSPQGDDWPTTEWIRRPRYANNVQKVSKIQAHKDFWKHALNTFDVRTVVTTNYDLLIERALRARPMKRQHWRGFYYGGFPRPQVLRGNGLVDKSPQILELTGSIPLFKLHGSLNWELKNNVMAIYQDTRPAFRGSGDSAIVPPLPEKEMPPWLSTVWSEAELQMQQVSTWIICGYSLPGYDIALAAFLKRSAGSRLKRIVIIDPQAKLVAKRLLALLPGIKIDCLPGLPDAIPLLQPNGLLKLPL
jgi:hypothetical protein